MIYGLVPIGGKGTRLGLTFSKEMLPQKGFLNFNPISNHIVNAMEEAGAAQIIFIHGFELKKDVTDFYHLDSYKHFLQKAEGFANVLREFLGNIPVEVDDKILFGMPDTIFAGNPFTEMLKYPSITCAIFTTNDETEVDRLYIGSQKFAVKQRKRRALQERFWGLLKFDGEDILNMEVNDYFSKYSD